MYVRGYCLPGMIPIPEEPPAISEAELEIKLLLVRVCFIVPRLAQPEEEETTHTGVGQGQAVSRKGIVNIQRGGPVASGGPEEQQEVQAPQNS